VSTYTNLHELHSAFYKLSFKFFFTIITGIFLTIGLVQNAFSNPGSISFYSLPFKAEDLKPGERISTGDHRGGNQAEGEDFGVKRYLGNKKWSSLKNGTNGKKNTDYLIYGKPIYAIGDGTIVGCWRNAPENPQPGERHAQKNKIPGGGNMLWVDHADGTRALYAHMIPGSIPSKLCSNDARLFPKAKSDTNHENNYVMLPDSKKVKVKKGQLLGKVGNSGSSSGPHLHLHMQKNGNAARMYFERGLYKSSNNADLDGWKSFAKKEIPDGQILIWPPRTIYNEYTRFGYKDEDFQRLFDHLVDSGYELEWIDGYSANNQGYLNFSWKPASGKKWKAYFGLTGSEYQKRFDRNKDLAPIFIDSYTIGNNIRYNLILKEVSGGYMARHGLTYKQHMKIMDEAKKRNLAPINISVASNGNSQQHTVLYRNQNYGAWNIKSQIKASEYQKIFDDFRKDGKTPVYINAYIHKNNAYFSAIFARNGGGSLKAKHGMSASALQTEWRNAVDNGFNTMILTSFDSASSSQHRYAGLWRK
jgi:murein DD-endopeptidase MepM/ murein hydrolase activator NlpD